MAPRLRVFAETADRRRLCSAEVLGALGARGLQLVLAVRGDDDPLPVVAAARAAGVSVALWPMIADAEGRWASCANAEAFATHARSHLQRLVDADAAPDELCIDLEPPLPMVRRMIDRDGRWDGIVGDRVAGTAALTRLIDDAAAHGVASWGAVVPLILSDRPSAPSWQRILGTPVDALPLRQVCVMLYTSLIVGYARGTLRRSDAEYLLASGAQRARQRWGARASVALGAVGRGALGDEAVYGDVEELRADVALARAAGIDDLALFDLGGVLQRPRPEAWLDAFAEPSSTPTPPRASRRARMIWWMSGTLSRAAALGAPKVTPT